MIASTSNRAANATIAGFVYQFDLTTLEILNAQSNTPVAVEGCEDIDLHKGSSAAAVQCKYLPASKYSLAGLRKPIIPMLESFADGREWDYRLYVHYGDSTTPPTKLTVDELKSCLTEIKRKPTRTVQHCEHLSHEVLERFLGRLSIQAGDAFETQQAAVHSALRTALGASAEDVRDLYYPSAVAHVMWFATRPKLSERITTREAFVAHLNIRNAMYTRWHAEHVGLERFRKALKRRLKATGALNANRRRLLVLRPAALSTSTLLSDVDLIMALATKMYGHGMLSDAKPWTVLLDAPDEQVAEIKKRLIEEGVSINDGFEYLQFSPRLFDRDAVINTKGSTKLIETSSYAVRCLSAGSYSAHAGELRPPAIAVSNAPISARSFTTGSSVSTVDIPGWSPEDVLDLLGAWK